METALRSGHNELRAEELVTWKVAGRVNDISYIRHTGRRGGGGGSKNHCHHCKGRTHKNENENKRKDRLMAHCSFSPSSQLLLILRAQHIYEYFTISIIITIAV